MKWCVEFPEESVLLVRPSLKRICLDNKPAAKLLSVLLYRYSIRKEAREDAQNHNEVKQARGETPDQDTTFRIFRKQAQLVTDAIDEMDEKTLHDVAVPTLQLLGYLDIEEHPGVYCYIVHRDRVQEAICAWKKSPKHLERFLKQIPQLEKVLIGVQLEKVLINKKLFSLELEKILIANRNISHNKRGRKTRQERAGEAQSEEPQIGIEIDSEIDEEEREGTGAFAPPARAQNSLSEIVELRDRTNHALEVASGFDANTWDAEQTVRASDHCPPFTKEAGRASPTIGNVTQENRPSQQTSRTDVSRSHTGAAPARVSPAASSAAPSGPRQGGVAGQPRPAEPLTERGAQIKGWIERIKDITISDTPGNIRAHNALARNPDVTFESLQLTIEFEEAMKYVKEHDIAIDSQRLADVDDKLNLSFEKNWPLARKRKRDGPGKAPSEQEIPPGALDLRALARKQRAAREARHAAQEGTQG